MKKRIEWIDIIKYLCIMLVMLTHLESCPELLRVFFIPFFLNLFFFCSGYVYKNNRGFKDFFKKKIRQLFIPWLVFSCFNIFLRKIISFHEHSNMLEELKWNFLQIRGSNDGLWFIAALFITYMPFYFYIREYEKSKSKYKNIIFVSISVILSFVSILYTKLMPTNLLPWNSANLPWHIEYIFQAMLYMFIGYIFKSNYEGKFDLYNTKKNRIIFLVIYLIIRYTVYFSKIQFPMVIDIFYNYISELLGIIVIIGYSKVLKSNRYFNYVGQNTLIYFALHGKIYSFLEAILGKFTIYSKILRNSIYSSIFAIIFTIVLSIILIIPTYIINKYLPFLLGREKSDKQKIQN